MQKKIAVKENGVLYAPFWKLRLERGGFFAWVKERINRRSVGRCAYMAAAVTCLSEYSDDILSLAGDGPMFQLLKITNGGEV